jgi:hypothetical protein
VQVAFEFLDCIKTHFLERYSEVVATAVAFEMNRTFGTVLTSQMHLHNTGAGLRLEAGAGERGAGASASNGAASASTAMGEKQKIEKVRGEEVKQVMTHNIDLILERGDKIELLVDKSLDLSEQVVLPASCTFEQQPCCLPRVDALLPAPSQAMRL